MPRPKDSMITKNFLKAFTLIPGLLLILALASCSAKTTSTTSGKGIDPAQKILSEAAIQVHEEMMTASSLMHIGKTRFYEPLLPRESSLMAPLEFKWVGPAWPAIQVLCERIKYRPRLQGTPPASDPVVTLNTTGDTTTVYDLLNDLNIQIRPYGGHLQVDSIHREIIINYLKTASTAASK